jgi:group I intron endonuclease
MTELGIKENEYYTKLNPTLNMKRPNINEMIEYNRIYKITYKIDNTQFYIGSTDNKLNIRLSQHKSAATKGKTPVYRFMRDHGKENFEIECVEDDIPVDQLIIRENYWIAQLNPPLNKNVNLCITEQERDRLKYIKNREKRLKQVTERRLLKRDEINAQKKEHYHANKEQINAIDKQKRKELREKEVVRYTECPNFTSETLSQYTVFKLKEIAKCFGLNKTTKLKDGIIDKILIEQDKQFVR